jgi:HD-GYP domain-containing protein (c-di-GMP phosphodiesterase class II)
VDELRLADLLAALSVTTDLGMGQEPEKAVRSCLLATELARTAGLPERQVRDVYYTSLLQHLGCTAPAHEMSHLFGDELVVLHDAEHIDESTLGGSLELLALIGRGTGMRRVQHLGRVVTGGKRANTTVMRSVCEVGARMAERLHLGTAVRDGLRDGTEIWDGRAGAWGRAGDDIAVSARFSLVAAQAVIFDRLGGPGTALAVVRSRAGHWFDPTVVDAFTRTGVAVLERLAEADVWREVLEAEPSPPRCIAPAQVDDVAAVFADMVDLKTPHTLGHSPGVADLAVAAAGRLGLPAARCATVHRAGLLHDLGRVAISNVVWEHPRRLTATQWEQVRLHPYHSERILDRAPVLAEAARLAGMHHERLDGSGYHHGVAGAAIPIEARLLAAADTFQALTQDRPHRAARPPEQAVDVVEAAVDSGALDGECVRAVVEAAGQEPSQRRTAWPAGLSDREVEVLRLVARGSSNRDIATELVISPRTAEHHVQHIYAKIGGSTRAAAALFAVEHGLVR